MTWVRGAAIRPVPAYAVVPESILASIEEELASGGDGSPVQLDFAFQHFEETQPELAGKMGDVLATPLHEMALALGYFLSVAIWLGFERAFPERLVRVTEDALQASEAALALEEELRASHTDEPLELDDIMAMEQPAVLAFVNDHVDAALDPLGHAETWGEGSATPGAEVDDVHTVYRAILLQILALSHAVTPADGSPGTHELMA